MSLFYSLLLEIIFIVFAYSDLLFLSSRVERLSTLATVSVVGIPITCPIASRVLFLSFYSCFLLLFIMF